MIWFDQYCLWLALGLSGFYPLICISKGFVFVVLRRVTEAGSVPSVGDSSSVSSVISGLVHYSIFHYFPGYYMVRSWLPSRFLFELTL